MDENVSLAVGWVEDILVTLEVVCSAIKMHSGMQIKTIMLDNDWDICILKNCELILKTPSKMILELGYKCLYDQISIGCIENTMTETF